MNQVNSISRVFAACAFALLAAASAQAASTDSSTPAGASELQQLPRASLQAHIDKIEPLPGQYVMSNGMRLFISSRNHQLLAGLDQQAPRRLRATGATNVYATPDGRMQLEFLAEGSGNPPTLRMTLLRPYAAPSVASTAEPVTLAHVD